MKSTFLNHRFWTPKVHTGALGYETGESIRENAETHAETHAETRTRANSRTRAYPIFHSSLSNFDLFERWVSGGGGSTPFEAVGARPPRHFVRGNCFHEEVQDGKLAENPGDEEIEFRDGKWMLGSQLQRLRVRMLLLQEMALRLFIVTMMMMVMMIIESRRELHGVC